jgi:hypothetical protein
VITSSGKINNEGPRGAITDDAALAADGSAE